MFFLTIGIRTGPSKEAWSLEERFIKMSNQEGVASIKPPLFNGSNLFFWKVITRYYLQSLGANVWEIIEGGYQYPSSIPTNEEENKKIETNAKAINALLGKMAES